MPVTSISSSHSFHIPSPRATEVGQGKAAQSPAFQARAGEWLEDTNFGQLVSAIAKAKLAAAPEAPADEAALGGGPPENQP